MLPHCSMSAHLKVQLPQSFPELSQEWYSYTQVCLCYIQVLPCLSDIGEYFSSSFKAFVVASCFYFYFCFIIEKYFFSQLSIVNSFVRKKVYNTLLSYLLTYILTQLLEKRSGTTKNFIKKFVNNEFHDTKLPHDAFCFVLSLLFCRQSNLHMAQVQPSQAFEKFFQLS